MNRGERIESFWPLWRKHSPRLFAICLREMSRNWADAEDAAAEAMLRAYDNIPSQLDNTEAWLTRVTINVCRDLQRTRVRTEALKAQYAKLQLTAATLSEHPQPEECDLHLMLERLPKPLREALVLRVVHRAPYEDIAARLGISPANVRKRVQHARATLRAMRNAGAHEPVPMPPPEASSIHETVRRIVRVQLPSGDWVEVEIDVHAGLPERVSKKIASLRAYVARHPSGWKMRLQLADLLYATGAWSDAADCYRAVMERRPYLQEARARLAAIERVISS